MAYTAIRIMSQTCERFFMCHSLALLHRTHRHSAFLASELIKYVVLRKLTHASRAALGSAGRPGAPRASPSPRRRRGYGKRYIDDSGYVLYAYGYGYTGPHDHILLYWSTALHRRLWAMALVYIVYCMERLKTINARHQKNMFFC